MGISIVSTVSSAAAGFALTDLSTAKDEIAVTDTTDDAWLTRAIAQVSRSVMNYCSRTFWPESLSDLCYIEQDPYPYQTPGGVAPLQLSRFPLLSMSSVLQTIALNTTQALVSGTDFTVDNDRGQLIRLNPFTGVATTWEALPVTAAYTAGFGAVAAENHTVPSGASPQLTVTNQEYWSFDRGVAYAGGAALVAVAANPTVGQYTVSDGTYGFNTGDATAPVVVSYAYAVIPDDLVDVVLRLVTQRFKARGRDPLLMQRDVPQKGTERWWVGAAQGQNGAFPPEISGILDKYRVPVVA